MAEFQLWQKETLVKFAEDAMLKMQAQDWLISALRANAANLLELLDAECKYSKAPKCDGTSETS